MVWYDRLSVFPVWLGKNSTEEECRNSEQLSLVQALERVSCAHDLCSSQHVSAHIYSAPSSHHSARSCPGPITTLPQPIPCYPTWLPVPQIQTFSILFALCQKLTSTSTLLINCLFFFYFFFPSQLLSLFFPIPIQILPSPTVSVSSLKCTKGVSGTTKSSLQLSTLSP